MAKTPKIGSKNEKQAPRRNRYAKAIGDLLPDIGRASFRRFGFVQSSVVSRWPEIVGERYAEVSNPVSIRFPHGKRSGGTLRLTVSGAHATMMQHIEPEIIERVNRFFGYPAVVRITIQQGHPPEKRIPRTAPPSLRPVPAALGDSLREVDDPELKACLEGLAASIAASSNSTNLDDGIFDKRKPPQQLQVKRLSDIGRREHDGVTE